MKTFARHDIRLRPQYIANAGLHVHQFDEAESRIIGVEEQIDVTICSRLISGHRTEKIKMSDAKAMEISLAGPQSLYYLLSGHGRRSEARLMSRMV